MRKLLIYLVPVLAFCLLNITSCKDENEEMPRLFRPSFIASSCFAEGNTISLAWRTSGEATSYTVELSRDATFQAESAEVQTVKGNKCTFSNLRYETGYYARVRANNEGLDIISNWTEYTSSIKTLSRVIPKILYAPDENLIMENSAVIEWKVSDTNPVDGVSVWLADGGSAGEKHFDLSASEIASGKYMISGLSPRSTYLVALTNSKAPEGAEKYNQRKFTTAGMPAGAVLATDGVDLLKKIKEGMNDDSKSSLIFQLQNGVDYYLSADGLPGSNTGDIKLTKSIAFLANPGERPTLYIRKGGFIIKPELDNIPEIEYFIVENVNVKEPVVDGGSGGSKTRLLNIGKHDAGTDITIDRFEIRNSDIVLPSSVLMMNDASEGTTTIKRIRIDNCRVTGINDTKYVTKQFGFIHAINKGSDVWSDVSVTNSTFYEFYISPGVFGVLTADVPVAPNSKVSISNCTFYNWATSKTSYTAIGNFSKLSTALSVSVSGCVFGYSAGKAIDPGTCSLTAKNNYCTTDFEQASDKGLPLIALGLSDSSFFRNAKDSDFTVIDFESVVYTQEYGDPYWITVQEY